MMRRKPPAEVTIGFQKRHAHRLLMLLLGFELAMVVGYCLVQALPQVPWGPVWHLTNLDLEQSVPTWFSSLQLFGIGGLLLAVATLRPQPRRFLILVGLAFVALSADEVAGVHEMMSVYSVKSGAVAGDSSMAVGVWVLAYAAIGVAMLLICLRPVLWLWTRHRAACVWVGLGVVLMAAAIGVEVLAFQLFSGDRTGAPYVATIALEELCEMAGASVILYGVMRLGLSLQREPVAEAVERPAPLPDRLEPVDSYA